MNPAFRIVSMVALASALSGCLLQPTTRVEPPHASRRSPPPVAASARPATQVATPAGQYVVRPGDTLYSIAFRHGLDHRRLAEWNRLSDPSRILVGQTLRLTAPAAPPPAIPAPRSTPAPATRAPSNTAPVPVQPGRLTQAIGTTPTPAPVPTPSPLPEVSAGGPSSGPSTVPLGDDAPLDAPIALPESGNARPAQPTVSQGSVNPPPTVAPPTSRTAVPAPVAQPTAPSQAVAAPEPKPVALPPPVAAATPATAPLPAVNPNAPSKQVGGIRWRWPTEGKVIGRFVPGDPTESGIDIGGRLGQHVLAAADGEVVYSGNGLLGYGELIIIQHTPEFLSAYGHNQKRLVTEGSKVKAGQPIAEMGRQAGIDLLHFEIRQGGKPVDPLKFLP